MSTSSISQASTSLLFPYTIIPLKNSPPTPPQPRLPTSDEEENPTLICLDPLPLPTQSENPSIGKHIDTLLKENSRQN